MIDEGSVFLLALEQAKGVYGAHQLLIGDICLGTALLHDTYDDFRLLVRPFLLRFLERLFLVLKVGDPWGERLELRFLGAQRLEILDEIV